MTNDDIPVRQIRARYTDDTITVYQAYGDPIADAALRARTFVAPFSHNRMTWIKPSFLWMMYRCGWAEKPGQTRVLAVTISRDGFEWALRHSCLSHYDRDRHESPKTWTQTRKASPVRVQWDPERSLHLAKLNHRSIQIGLSGTAVQAYAAGWILGIEEVTDRAREIHALVRGDDLSAAASLLPKERPYPVPADIAAAVGIVPLAGQTR